jgi:serine/threonine protein phosphatase PrpC
MNYEFVFSEVTDVGLLRKENEDKIGNFKTPNGHLFVLCDGMGGAAGGKIASKIAVESLHEYFTKQKYSNLQIALHKSIEFANEQIYATANAEPKLAGMGTTCNLMLIYTDKIYFAHVGDSRIYIFSDDKLIQLTKDHSFTNQLVEQGKITEEEAKTHFAKNRLVKALGTSPIIEPDVSPEPLLLKKDDKILLCSDGLTDMVEDEIIQHQFKSESGNLDAVLHSLLTTAIKNGGKDNISIQLIEITKSPYSNSIYQTIKKNLISSGRNRFLNLNNYIVGAVVLTLFLVISIILLVFRNNLPDIHKIKQVATTFAKPSGKNEISPDSLFQDVLEVDTLKVTKELLNDDITENQEKKKAETSEAEKNEQKEFEELKETKACGNYPSLKACRDFLNKYPDNFLNKVNELAYHSAICQMQIQTTVDKVNNIFRHYNKVNGFNYRLQEVIAEKENLIHKIKEAESSKKAESPGEKVAPEFQKDTIVVPKKIVITEDITLYFLETHYGITENSLKKLNKELKPDENGKLLLIQGDSLILRK